MELKNFIEERLSNIGNLVKLFHNNDIMLTKLKTSRNFKFDYTISEMIKIYIYDLPDQICICDKKLKWIGFKSGWMKTCSNECCIKQQRELSCLEKYGVTNPRKNNEVKKKTTLTCLEKYGETTPTKNKNIKEKTKIKWLGKSDEEISLIKKKKQITFERKTDVEKKQIIDKREFTFEQKYGVKTIFKNEDIKNNIIVSNNEKYGDDCILNNNEIRQKIASSNKRRNIEILKSKLINFNCEYIDHFVNDNETIIYILNDLESNEEFTISYSSLNYKLKNNIRLNKKDKSLMEVDLFNFVKILTNYEVIKNYKINNLEIDIYIKELNIGIEFNGLYWHSDHFKNKDFHFNKSLQCKNQGIKLLHIWEDDWKFKKNIVKTTIENIFKIYKPIENIIIKEIDFEYFQYLHNIYNLSFLEEADKFYIIENDEILSLFSLTNNIITNFYTKYDTLSEIIKFINYEKLYIRYKIIYHDIISNYFVFYEYLNPKEYFIHNEQRFLHSEKFKNKIYDEGNENWLLKPV